MFEVPELDRSEEYLRNRVKNKQRNKQKQKKLKREREKKISVSTPFPVFTTHLLGILFNLSPDKDTDLLHPVLNARNRLRELG